MGSRIFRNLLSSSRFLSSAISTTGLPVFTLSFAISAAAAYPMYGFNAAAMEVVAFA
jgi:hypothetical protein